MGLRPVQMAGRLGLTLSEYRALEAGELHIDYDLYLRDRPMRVAAVAAASEGLPPAASRQGAPSAFDRPRPRFGELIQPAFR